MLCPIPERQVRSARLNCIVATVYINHGFFIYFFMQGAIMAVGASRPTVVASKDGRIGMKNQMQVTNILCF